jgi:hypothetical protein
MTFPLDRALWFFAMRNYNPSPLPEPPFTMWYAPGWATNFLEPSADIDPARSVYTLKESGAGNGRSYICPSRTHGQNYMSESFEVALAGRWDTVIWNPSQGNAGSGQVLTPDYSDPDPAVSGKILDLHTGLANGSVAGIQRTLSYLPPTYGTFVMPRLKQVGTNPANALNIWSQDNNGKALKLRYYDFKCDVELNITGTYQWHNLLTDIAIGDYFAEHWIERVDQGNGAHAVRMYIGTRLWKQYVGALPTAALTTNNTVLILQTNNEAGVNMRRSQVGAIHIGDTQLADPMVACSYARPWARGTPTRGHVALFVEDVSDNIDINASLIVSVTRNDTANWHSITMNEIAPHLGYGEIDNTKKVRLFVGSVDFTGPNGGQMRYLIESLDHRFPLPQALAFFWDC